MEESPPEAEPNLFPQTANAGNPAPFDLTESARGAQDSQHFAESQLIHASSLKVCKVTQRGVCSTLPVSSCFVACTAGIPVLHAVSACCCRRLSGRFGPVAWNMRRASVYKSERALGVFFAHAGTTGRALSGSARGICAACLFDCCCSEETWRHSGIVHSTMAHRAGNCGNYAHYGGRRRRGSMIKTMGNGGNTAGLRGT